jgi:DeoR/GlpR family transcriptional regulator of sugar metabolism
MVTHFIIQYHQLIFINISTTILRTFASIGKHVKFTVVRAGLPKFELLLESSDFIIASDTVYSFP